jgi:hypothetical protein
LPNSYIDIAVFGLYFCSCFIMIPRIYISSLIIYIII